MKKEVKEKKVEDIEEEPKEITLEARTSRKLYIPLYLMIFALAVALIYIKINEKPLNNLALKLIFFFSLIIIIATEIHRLYDSYEIANTSVFHRKGFFTVITKRIQFGAISDSDVKQNLWQRIFSYGDVEIHMYSRESRAIIKDINNPGGFVKFLQDKMSKSGGRSR